jgi:hypothetical protein
MVKKLVLILVVIIVIQNLSAMTISEVELNPAGSNDIGNEWIEFYSAEPVSLEGYTIYNNDYAAKKDAKDMINLSGTVNGYFVYTLSRQWLDDSDEKIFLYKGNILIDETKILVDSQSNDKTWQFCTNWSFADSTKGTKNCEKQVVEEEPEKTTIHNDSAEEIKDITDDDTINPIKEEIKSIGDSEAKEGSIIETIKLKSQSLKTENSFDLKENFAKYSLITFCLLLVLLFLLKGKKYKNEFQRSKKN